MQGILMAGDNCIIGEDGASSYARVLAHALSRDFKVCLSSGFLRAVRLAGDVDTVFALSPVGGGYDGYLSARLRKKRFLIRIDDDYAWRAAIDNGSTYLLAGDFQKAEKNGQIAALHKRQVRLCTEAELVIVPSEFMSEIVYGWGVNRGKIKVISDAVELPDIQATKEEARKRIGIAGNLLISVGPLVPWKGFRMLIKIVPQLIGINQFFRLVIVGDGPERKTLKTMIQNTGLDKKVYLIGQKNKEELAWLLAASDTFILNSGHEPFPLAAIEAMSAGIPVITTAVGASPELIRQGENGFMVKYNDEFNLVEAIKTVWQNPELRERFIGEGKKTAAEFSTEKMISETVAALNK